MHNMEQDTVNPTGPEYARPASFTAELWPELAPLAGGSALLSPKVANR